ncbi:MFS transporter [Pseudonocardia benzenivorans]
MVLSSMVFLVVRLAVGDGGFVSWGWRLPFLASAVLVVVGLVIRLKLDESPEFERLRSAHTVRRAPIADVFRAPRIWIPASGVTIAASVLGNLLLAFVLGYAAQAKLHSASTMLTVTMVAALLWTVALPLAAVLAGRYGRRPVLVAGIVAMGLWAFPYFALVESGSTVGLFVGSTVAALTIALMTGPYGAYLAEAFPAEVRYSGASVAYGIGGVLGGACAPIVATLLASSTGGSPLWRDMSRSLRSSAWPPRSPSAARTARPPTTPSRRPLRPHLRPTRNAYRHARSDDPSGRVRLPVRGVRSGPAGWTIAAAPTPDRSAHPTGGQERGRACCVRSRPSTSTSNAPVRVHRQSAPVSGTRRVPPESNRTAIGHFCADRWSATLLTGTEADHVH